LFEVDDLFASLPTSGDAVGARWCEKEGDHEGGGDGGKTVRMSMSRKRPCSARFIRR